MNDESNNTSWDYQYFGDADSPYRVELFSSPDNECTVWCYYAATPHGIVDAINERRRVSYVYTGAVFHDNRELAVNINRSHDLDQWLEEEHPTIYQVSVDGDLITAHVIGHATTLEMARALAGQFHTATLSLFDDIEWDESGVKGTSQHTHHGKHIYRIKAYALNIAYLP